MKSTTLVTALTSLTKAMAVAAAIVVFGFLYVLLVQPQRIASLGAQGQLEMARDELNRQRALARSHDAAAASAVNRVDEFEARAAEGNRVSEVVDAVSSVLNSPAVGSVSNVIIATGQTGDGPVESIVGPLSPKVSHTPVTVTFDARYEQIGRFFANLRVLPTTFDLQSVELVRQAGSSAGSMRVKTSLLVFHRSGLVVRSGVVQAKADDSVATPKRPVEAVAKPAAPVPSDPVVTSILISGGRAVALVDGRVVRPGDRLQEGVVQSIEPDAVVIAVPGGQTRRIMMAKRDMPPRSR